MALEHIAHLYLGVPSPQYEHGDSLAFLLADTFFPGDGLAFLLGGAAFVGVTLLFLVCILKIYIQRAYQINNNI